MQISKLAIIQITLARKKEGLGLGRNPKSMNSIAIYFQPSICSFNRIRMI